MRSDSPPPAYPVSQSQFSSTNQSYPGLAPGNTMSKGNQDDTYGNELQQLQVSPSLAVAASQAHYGPYSVHVICPGCGNQVNTKTEFATGAGTWLSCFGCFTLGCLLCWCFPFYWDCTKDVVHECPNCCRKLGLFKRV